MAAPLPGVECVLRLCKECHQPKKKQYVCAACWKKATPDQRESLKKYYDDPFCAEYGCWEWPATGGAFCKAHFHRQQRKCINQQVEPKQEVGGVAVSSARPVTAPRTPSRSRSRSEPRRKKRRKRTHCQAARSPSAGPLQDRKGAAVEDELGTPHSDRAASGEPRYEKEGSPAKPSSVGRVACVKEELGTPHADRAASGDKGEKEGTPAKPSSVGRQGGKRAIERLSTQEIQVFLSLCACELTRRDAA